MLQSSCTLFTKAIIDLWYFAKFVGKFKLTPQFSFVKLVEIFSGGLG